ncbi:MAG: LacI family DNA-binding transcriptional regulator [Chloroflexi bacterium]|nr:LacI family DNA-binding transcriptional regulator [Chloroflexota bacterium]
MARRAGVSLSTASRVLNDTGYPVAEATRQRVLEAAHALQYSPSVLARALVTRRTQIVGVIVGDVEDPYFAEIVRGVEDVARKAGYLVIVCNADRDPVTELSYLQTLHDYRVDGVILAAGGVTDAVQAARHADAVARLEQQGTVVVALAEVAAAAPCITIDNRAAAAEMARYVVGLGHREIGVIAGPATLTTSRARLQGIRGVLDADVLPEDRVMSGVFTADGGEQAAQRLLDQHPSLTALICVNDQMAVGALTAAHRRGLAVPEQLSIVGFGDTTAARLSWPPLTTMSVPRHEMGALAMTGLLEQLDGGPRVASRVLTCPLRVRGSSGPPPA